MFRLFKCKKEQIPEKPETEIRDKTLDTIKTVINLKAVFSIERIYVNKIDEKTIVTYKTITIKGKKDIKDLYFNMSRRAHNQLCESFAEKTDEYKVV